MDTRTIHYQQGEEPLATVPPLPFKPALVSVRLPHCASEKLSVGVAVMVNVGGVAPITMETLYVREPMVEPT